MKLFFNHFTAICGLFSLMTSIGAFAAAGDKLLNAANPGAGATNNLDPYFLDYNRALGMAALSNGNLVVAWSERENTTTTPTATPNSPDGADGKKHACFFRVYGPTGTAVSAATRPYLDINADGTGWQRTPMVAALTGGGFVMVWNSVLGPGDTYDDGFGNGGDTWARVYDNSGTAVSGTFRVNDNDPNGVTDSQEPTSVVGLSGGGFAILWSDENDNAALGANANTDDYFLRVFAANGTPAAASIRLGGLGQDAFFKDFQAFGGASQGLIALSNNTVVVGWAVRDQSNDGTGVSPDGTAPNGGGACYFQIINASGAAVNSATAPYLDINPNASGSQLAPALAALTGGGFAVLWNSNHNTDDGGNSDTGLGFNGTNGGDTYVRVYTNTGTATSGTARVNDLRTGDTDEPSAIKPLTDGGFAIVWKDDENNTGNTDDYFARAYNANGTPRNPSIPIGGAAADPLFEDIDSTGFGMVPLSDGGYVVAIRVRDSANNGTGTSFDGAAGPGGFSAAVRVFNADGTSRAGPFFPYNDINPDFSGNQNIPYVCAIAGGGFAVAWHSNFNTNDTDNDQPVPGSQITSEGGDAYTRIFNNSGTALHATVQAHGEGVAEPTGTIDQQDPFGIIGLTGGNYALVIRDDNDATQNKDDIFLSIFEGVPTAPVATAPTVTTATQSSVTATSATLGGNVTADGGASVTERGIVWKTSTGPTTADNKVQNGSGTGVFSGTVNSLPANTTIFVRAYAINSVGTSYGNEISFTTLAPTASIAVSPSSVSEDGATNLTYTVTLSATVTASTTVNITTTGTATSGTATSGTDYSGGVATVVIPANTATGTITINPSVDGTVESDETVILTVASGTGYTVGVPASATGTILNDDMPSATIAVSPSSVAEDGAPNLIYTVTLNQPSLSNISVNYTVGGTAANGTDYATVASPLVINAGNTTGTITINPTADANIEADETVTLTLAVGTGYSVGVPNSATGTILNDDLPNLSVNDVTLAEGNSGTTNFAFTVSLNAPAGPGGVSFNIAAASGSATSGTDFVAQSLTAQTIPAGSSSYTFTVQVNGDSTVETNESFFVNVTGVTGAVVVDGQGVGTITNDDVAADIPLTLSSGTLTINASGSANAANVVLRFVAPNLLEIFDATRTIGAPAGGTQVNANTVRVPLSSVTSIVLTGSNQADVFTLDFSAGDICPTGGIAVNGGPPTSSPGDMLVVDGDFSSGGSYGTGAPGAGSLTLDSGNTVTFTGLEPLDLSAASFTDYTVTVDPGSVFSGNVTTTVAAVNAGVNTEVTFGSSGLESVKLGTVTGTLTIEGDNVEQDYFVLQGLGSAMTGNFTVDGRGGDSDVIEINNTTLTVAGLNKNLSLKADFIGLGRVNAVSPGDNPGVIVCSGNITLEADGDSSIVATNLWTGTNVWGASVPAYFNALQAPYAARGTVQILGDIRKTAGNDATLTVKAKHSALVLNTTAATGTSPAGSIVSTNNKLHVILNSDSDASGAGNVMLQHRSVVTTNGGALTIGGGATPATLPAQGIAGATTTAPGVSIISSAITTAGGDVSIRGQGAANGSGVGVLFNVSAGSVNGSLSTGAGNVTIAGTGGANTVNTHGFFLLGNATAPALSSGISTTSGNVSITGTAGGGNNDGIRLSTLSSIARSGAGAINLTGTGVGTGFGVMVNPASVIATVQSIAGTINLTADTMNLNGGAGAEVITTGSATSGTITLKPLTAGFSTTLGAGAADSIFQLGIDATTELPALTAGTVQIGGASTGNLAVNSVISPSTFTTLSLVSGTGTVFTPSGGFAADVTSASNYEKIAVTGTFSITGGATFSAASAGGYVWNGTDTFTFLDNDLADAISGTFTGPTLTNFLGSTFTATQSYSGGTGNDFVITAPPSANADLAALTTTAGALSPAFGAATTSYSTPSVPNATASVTVTATRAQANATLEARINGGAFTSLTSATPSGALALNVGPNTIDVKVTAQDTTTTKTYTINVTRSAPPTAPTIVSAAPSRGLIGGGGSIVITGTDFTGATAVNFGTTAATSFTVDSATQITATVPAGTAGISDISVITGLGTGTGSGLFYYYTTSGTTPAMAAAKVDLFTPNGAGKVLPGAPIQYRTLIANTGGGNATSVDFADAIPANTTLVPGSVNVSPLAEDDVYTTIVNTQLAAGTPTVLSGPLVTSAVKVTDNDREFLSDTFTISAFDSTSANGGSVVMVTSGGNAGSFTYVPPAGFVGADSFTYTIRDDGTDSTASNADDLTGSGIVVINVTDANTGLAGTQKVWYIDSSYAGANGTENGTSARPFNALSDVSGATGPDVAGDTLALRTGSGDYTGGITLLADQTLLGANEALVLNSITLATAGIDPVITNSGGAGVTLATGNTLRGFTVGDTTGGDISGTAVGSLTISNLICNGTGGILTVATSGALNVTIDSAATTNAVNAFALSGTTGTCTITTGATSGVTGDDFSIVGGTAVISYGGTISNSAGRSVAVINKTGGSVTFSGQITDTAGSTGILCNSNTGATITFSGGLSLTTTTNNAFTAINGGTVNVTGANNTLTTTTGTALNVVNTTIGASGLTFQNISKNGGTNNAIILDSTGSTGGLTVTGTGTAGSGGTLQNISGADAISLNNVGGLVSLSRMIIQDITASNDGSAALHTHSGVDAIHGRTISGGLTLSNCTIQRISDNAINGTVDASPVTNSPTVTTWSGLTLTNCTFSNTNRFNVANLGDATNESAVIIWGIKGTVSMTGCSFTNTSSGLDFITDTSGTLDTTIQGNTFTTLYKEIGTNSVGRFGISIVQRGSLTSTIRIGDTLAESNAILGNTFTNGGNVAAIRAITDTGATGAMKVSTARNTFTVTDHSSPGQAPGNLIYNFPQSGVLYRSLGSGNFEGIFAANTLTEVMHADGGLGQLTLIAERGESEFIVRNNTFDKPWDQPMEIRADGQSGGQTGCKVLITGNTHIDGTVGDGTTDLGGPAPYGPSYIQVRNNGRMDLTMQNEATPLGLTDTSSTFGTVSLYTQTTSTGDVLNLFLQGVQGPRGYRLSHAAGSTFNLFRNGSAGGTPQIVLQDNLVRGGSGVDTTNPPTVTATGTITLSSVAPVLPSITAPLLFAENLPPLPVKAAFDATDLVDLNDVKTVNTVKKAPQAPQTALTAENLEKLVIEAKARWEATGLSEAQKAALQALRFEISDLSTLHLGQASGDLIQISRTAAGNAWFIDETPSDDSEFTHLQSPISNLQSSISDRVDLLTTLLHEIGHRLGLPDTYALRDRSSIMYGYLTRGERRLPVKNQARGASVSTDEVTRYLGATINIGTLPAGKSVTIVGTVLVNNPPGTQLISSQGTVSGSNFTTFVTDDPAVGGTTDITTTPVERPDATVVSAVIGTSPTNASSLSWAVTFSSAVSDVAASHFALANTGLTAPSITSVSAVGPQPTDTWSVTVNTGTGSGTLGLNMTSDAGALSHDVTNLPFTGQVYTIDKIAPVFSSLVRQTPAGQDTNADTLTFRATFSEAVVGVDATDFTVSGTTATITGITGTGPYDITLSGGNLANLNGTVSLALAGAQNIADAAGNALPGTAPATNQTYTVDNTAPTVAISSATGNPAANAVIPVTVQFSETVTGFDLTDITVGNGSKGNFTAVDGDTYTFDLTPSGPGVTVTADVAGSAAQDAAGNNNSASTQFARTIVDSVSIAATTATAVEGGATGLYTFTRGSSSGALTVSFQLDGSSTATAGTDFNLTSSATLNFTGGNGTIEIPNGQLTATVTLTALAETVNGAEAAETARLNVVAGTGYVPATTPNDNATVTITENSFLVTTTADSGTGSLRQAILNANSIPGTDTVTFSDGTSGTANFTDGTLDTITLTSGHLGVTSAVIVNGPGVSNLAVSGNNASRVFFSTTSGVSLTVTSMSLINGSGDGDGGAIIMTPSNTLNLTDCVVSASSTTNSGGGIAIGGTANINRCTIAGNTAGGGNGAAASGGVYVLGALNLINSTVSGNSVTSTLATNGGGVLQNGNARITNCTITNNSVTGAVGAGGVSVIAGTVTVANTIIAGNVNNTVVPDVTGSFVSAGNNLIGNSGPAAMPVLQVFSPAAVAGFYPVGTANFGPALTAGGVSSGVVQGSDAADGAGPSTTDCCSALTNAPAVAGSIAIVDRGTCGFAVKVKNAQNAGAVAVIIVNNVAGAPTGMAGTDPTITIPSVMVSQADGNALKAQLASGVVASMKLVSPFLATGDLSGTGAAPLDPLLGPLAANGGPTQTHALLSGSPALNSGNTANAVDQFSVALATDQRGTGFTRAIGTVDIGAFELQKSVSILADAASAAEGTLPAGNTAFTFTVSRTGDTTGAVTMDYAVSGAAVNATDFGGTLPSGTVTIPDGSANTTLTINVSKDTTVEPNEAFTVTLSNANNGYSITTATASSTINNDDAATVTVAKVNDGAETNTPTAGLFRLTQSAASSVDTTVAYTVGGTATSGTDFTALSGTATITAGNTTADISVPVLNDAIVEITETATVTVNTVTSVNNVTAGATLNASLDITDNDTATVTIAKISDGAETPASALFRVTQTAAATTATTLTYTVGGTATSGSDFTALSGTVTIPANSLTADISVTITNDALVEPTETIALTLTGLTGDADVSLGATTNASANITDDDTATVTIAKINDGNETGPANALFRVTQTAQSSVNTVLAYTVGGTTTSGSDFTALSGSVTILAGQTTADISVAITDDALVEATEAVSLTLTGVTSGNAAVGLGATLNASADITDNDSATVTLAKVNDGVEASPPTDAAFRVTQTAVSSTDTVITYTVGGTATAGFDYTTLSGFVTIPAGSTTAGITVPVLNENVVEATETVSLTLTGFTVRDPDVTLGATLTASADITDSDTSVITLAKVAADRNEGTGGASTAFTFSATLSDPVQGGFSLAYATNDGTALAGSDYTDNDNTLTFTGTASESKTITVSVTHDGTHELDENFTVALGAVSGLSAGINTSRVTTAASPQTGDIRNDDVLTISITAPDADADENLAAIGFWRVTRNSVVGNTTVQLQIDASSTAVAADWTQGGATFGSLAPGSAGTIVIPAGDTFVQFSLTPSADLHAEAAETVRVNVTADAAYTLGSPTNATVTIGQNDFLVINTNDAGEGTLRQAVLNANALPGADTIIFSDGTGGSVNFTDATADTITLSGGELTLASDVTIAGTGANLLTLQNTQAASATSRVFNIVSGVVRLNGLAITGGNSTTNGGGIQIAAATNVTLVGCAVAGNSTTAFGGGIYAAAFNLSIVSSTISGNSAAGVATAGGIHTTGTTFTLLNSTVSGNSSTAVTGNNAGGMLGSGTMINSTVTNNSVANPDPAIVGGVGGGFTIANSLVAANVGNTTRPDVGGFLTSNGGNVIGNVGTATGFTATNDLTGTSVAPINPLLGPLADNGGPTLTHVPLNGSPAINNGLVANLPADTFDADGDTNVAEALPLDQRGGSNLRTRGPAPDAGAVEAFAFEPTITASPATLEDTQTTSGLVITANTADGGLTTHYQITGITAGTLFKNDGTTVIAENDFITKAEGAAGLKFTPGLNLNDGTTALFGFTVQAAVGTAAGDQRGATVSTTISVTPVNDAPTVVAPGIPDQTVTVGTPVVVALPAHFTDVELDKLTFTVQSNSDAAKATAAITGGTNVTLTALAYGDTNVTIQANDGNGGTVTDTFTVFARTVDPTGTMDAPPGGAWVFSPLNGLFNTTATVQNTTANAVNGMRLTVNVVAYLAAHPSLRLWNATRTIAPGIFEIDYPYPVASQASVKFNLNFHTSTRQFPNPFAPGLTVAALPTSAVPGPLPAGLTFVASEIRLSTAGRIVLEWASTYGKWYRIYYNDGLDPNQWLPCATPIQAGSNRQQWSDEGAPFTAAPPGAARFYRVTEIAAP